MFTEIKCSSCSRLGYTNSVVYDLPRFLILRTRSNVDECVNFIDDIDQLVIRPTATHRQVEYNVQTAMIVLEEDHIVYLKKNSNGYSSYNESTNQFESLNNVTAEDTGLASRWTLFVYETADASCKDLLFQKTILDVTDLPSAVQPEDYLIETVNGLLRGYKNGVNVGFIKISADDMKVLLDKNGDINDLIIDAHLSITASNERVLAIPTYLIRQIIFKKVKNIPISWLNYDILLCPINQNHHWYIIIIDLKNKLILQLDSLLKRDLPRLANMNHILHVLNLQHYLNTQTEIDFANDWNLITFDDQLSMQQTDNHSCGVRLLVQAQAYVNRVQFINITEDKILLYRYQIAEALLRRGDPDSSGSSTTSVSLLSFLNSNTTHIHLIF